MDRLSKYIDSGKGKGWRYFFGFSIFLTLILGVFLYTSLRQVPYQEQVQRFLDTFPTVTIQDGRITEPLNTHWISPNTSDTLAFEIDTRSEQPSDAERRDGVYLLPTYILLKTNDMVQTLPWTEETTVLTRQKLIDTFQETLVLAIILTVGIIFIILWLGLILTTVLSRIILWIMRRRSHSCKVARSALIGWTSVVLLNVGLILFGYGFSVLTMILLATIIAIVGVFYTT
jgi:hypothetical protein